MNKGIEKENIFFNVPTYQAHQFFIAFVSSYIGVDQKVIKIINILVFFHSVGRYNLQNSPNFVQAETMSSIIKG